MVRQIARLGAGLEAIATLHLIACCCSSEYSLVAVARSAAIPEYRRRTDNQ